MTQSFQPQAGFTLLLVCIITMLFYSCDEEITGQLNDNIPPETTIFIESSDTLNPTRSIQTIYWDGRDPDGFVTGFFYTFEENPQTEDWVWTTERFRTFPLQITGSDTVYLFQIKAVDNVGAEDPTPANQRIPIKNSPPEIGWTLASTIPDTTFTVASFSWEASDLDGDTTIAFFEYALDDTSTWLMVPGNRRSLTLTEDDGVTVGDHAFFIRAVDIAGARSTVIRMPEDPTKLWAVRAPQGRYLLIDDYAAENSTSGFPDAYYRSMMGELLPPLGENYSSWNIEKFFPASVAQFSETLKLFERIVWYSDLINAGDDHFIAAQVAIPEFRNTGGKIIYTVQFNTGFGSQGSPLGFSPVESLGQSFNVIATNSTYYADPAYQAAFPMLPPLPELSVSNFILGSIALNPKATSIPMYRYDAPNTAEDPIFVMVGRNDNTGEFDFVFSGTPLHFLRGNNNLNDFFETVFRDLFQP